MGETALLDAPVAKKRTGPKGEPKQNTTLIRVSTEFAAAVRDAASFEKISVAHFATAHLQPVVEKRYRDAVMREAKRMGGKDS